MSALLESTHNVPHPLTWLERGFNPIPLKSQEKKPAVGGWGGATSRHTHGDPLFSPDEIERWITQFGGLSWAVLPGSGDCTVVDIDRPELLEVVLDVCGDTPVRTSTPSGGVHLWYRGASRSQNAICAGVDLKSNGGYVVMPGTSGKKGTYVMLHWETPPYPKAGWRDRLAGLGAAVVRPTAEDLTALLDAAKPYMRGKLRHVIAGEPFADKGARDTTLYKIVCFLATQWPYAHTEHIVALLSPSLNRFGSDGPTCEDVAHKWERAVHSEREKRDMQFDQEREDRRLGWSWVGIDSDEPIPNDTSPKIAHVGPAYTLRVGTKWTDCRQRQDALSPDTIRVLRALYDNVPETTLQCETECSFRPTDMRYSYLAPESRLTEDNVLLLSCAARRPITPCHDPEIEAWLESYSGPHWPQLRAWLIGLIRLDHPLRLLLLSGPRNVGKTLLIAGLSRIWTHGAVQMRGVLGKQFNDPLLRTPLVVGDDDMGIGPMLLTHIREGVTARTQAVEAKFLPKMAIEGCLRFIVATNDARQLLSEAAPSALNDDAIEAIADRILHLPVQAATPPDTHRMVEGDALAAHVLALGETYGQAYRPDDRCWVGPTQTDLPLMLRVNSALRKEILYRCRRMEPGVTREGDDYVIDMTMFGPAWTPRPSSWSERLIDEAIYSLSRRAGRIPAALVHWASR